MTRDQHADDLRPEYNFDKLSGGVRGKYADAYHRGTGRTHPDTDEAPWSDCEHLAIVDLEATCDDRGRVPRPEMEIIEIGAVMLRTRDLIQVSELQSFVRPVRHPVLTDFCMGLTTISQQEVDSAPTFPEVLGRLEAWLSEHPGAAFCSWGEYDRRQIGQDCAFHGLSNPMPAVHFNLKKLFAEAQRMEKKPGMARALRRVGLEVQGTHHRGIDDARNIARLVPFCAGSSG